MWIFLMISVDYKLGFGNKIKLELLCETENIFINQNLMLCTEVFLFIYIFQRCWKLIFQIKLIWFSSLGNLFCAKKNLFSIIAKCISVQKQRQLQNIKHQTHFACPLTARRKLWGHKELIILGPSQQCPVIFSYIKDCYPWLQTKLTVGFVLTLTGIRK